ncbi:putative serine carboxypeptidase 3-like [Capsicum annuum]|nr:putative serine carboxypeptidase 3-like [Capsicum annuum]KAF3679978.1 putative serine carboxypeptidase 3-like [Capsicum annuum]
MAMTITTAMASPFRRLLINSQHNTLITSPKNVAIYPATSVTKKGLLNLNHSVFSQVSLRPLVKPVCAADSGLEADLGDDESLIRVKNAKIVVESEDDEKIKILGEERITNFVIPEIVTSSLADYVKEENLTVKDNKISTTQTADELKSSFDPGTQFGFNATLELEKAKTEATT